MVASRVEGETFRHFDSLFYHDQINKVIDHVLPQFDRIVKRAIRFHLFFASLLAAELVLFFFFLGFLIESSCVAFSIMGIFFTLFAYLILRLTVENHKPKELTDLKERYLKACKHLLHYNEEIPEHLVELANACSKFASKLNGREYFFWRLPKLFRSYQTSLERLSCFWHWRDVLFLKEKLLQASVDEHIKLVRCEPTSLEVHAGLANAYVMLSMLYQDPAILDDRWTPKERYNEDLREKYRQCAKRAIEEFRILEEYAPEDPWVHAQLAFSYHDLKMPLEEIREYETIVRLCPSDKEALFKLGTLYFHLGQNADGLRVYETLRRSNFKKAEQLIEHYGECDQS